MPSPQCPEESSAAVSPLQMVMVLVLGPGAAYEARVGLVGSTLMGRSQLKVSTGTCSGPVQVTGSGCSIGGRRTKPGSRDVTNSKCNRHFRDTVERKDIGRGIRSQD